MLGVLAHQPSPRLRVGSVKRHAQRRDALLQDAPFVFGAQVGERHERAGKKAQAEIVVAQGKRGAHAFRQLAHKAKRAGVAALTDAIEHRALERKTPRLAFVALKLHRA